jgi:hypothetical protein
MKCPTHPAYRGTCVWCRASIGLISDDLAEMRARKSRPSVDWPAPPPAEGVVAPGQPDRLEEIAQKITSLERSGFSEPKQFLRNAHLDVLSDILEPDDFNFIATLRAATPRTPLAPIPIEPPSREQVAAEIRERDSRGESEYDISKATGQSRYRIRAILDSDTQ